MNYKSPDMDELAGLNMGKLKVELSEFEKFYYNNIAEERLSQLSKK